MCKISIYRRFHFFKLKQTTTTTTTTSAASIAVVITQFIRVITFIRQTLAALTERDYCITERSCSRPGATISESTSINSSKRIRIGYDGRSRSHCSSSKTSNDTSSSCLLLQDSIRIQQDSSNSSPVTITASKCTSKPFKQRDTYCKTPTKRVKMRVCVMPLTESDAVAVRLYRGHLNRSRVGHIYSMTKEFLRMFLGLYGLDTTGDKQALRARTVALMERLFPPGHNPQRL
jgi:hypothetical protein